MGFPLVTPSYFKEIVDVSKPVEAYDFVEIIASPAAIEYITHLRNPDVVRKLMSLEGILEYKMVQLPDKESEQFIEQSREALKINPDAAYYWQLRTLMMNTLQNRNVTFEKRMLLLNYAIKTIQGMIDGHQSNLIPGFISKFNENTEYEKILEYFKSITPSFDYALADGISLLKSVVKETPEYKDVLNTVYKNLGVSGPETLGMVDMKKYVQMRADFTNDFMEKHSAWIENIMINYVWSYSIPFAAAGRLTLWDNYVFFCALYNAVKILITCYRPETDDDFVKAVTSFDDALQRTGKEIVWKMVAVIKNAGQANNGDMAVLTIS